MEFRPLHDRVVVKRIDAEEKTAGGIIIPDTAKEKPSQGEVIAVGPGGRDEAGKLIPIDLKVGDRGEDRRPGAPDHEGIRHHGRARRDPRQAQGCVSTSIPLKTSKRSNSLWLPRKSNSRSKRATRCCAASTFSPTP